MGIEEKGQICVMIHSGSRGFGHQVATGNEYLIKFFPKIVYIKFYYYRCSCTNGKSYETRQY